MLAFYQLKASLTDFSFRVNNGVPEYSIDGGTTWNPLGGRSMPALNYASPYHTFNSVLTKTVTKDVYLCGNVWATNNETVNVTIDGTILIDNHAWASQNTNVYIPPLLIKSGSTVTVSKAQSTLGLFEEV